jgi:hypothetical protein
MVPSLESQLVLQIDKVEDVLDESLSFWWLVLSLEST